MKQNKLIGLLVVSASLILASCGNNAPAQSSSSSAPASSSSQSSQGSASSSSAPTSSSSTWSIDTSSGTIVGKKTFADALTADYSNVTLHYVQCYNDEESTEEAYEYLVDDYTVVYDYTFVENYGSDYHDRAFTIYHEYNNDWYQYWKKKDGYEYDGWISNGYRDADLGLIHAYFSLNDLIDSLTEDDVEYFLGAYYVTAEATSRVFNSAFGEFYGDMWTEDEFSSIAFLLDEQGRFQKIVGSVSEDSEDGISIEFDYYGSTVSPIDLPDAPNATNIYTYKDMVGDKYVEDVWAESFTLSITDGQEYKHDDEYDLILDIDESIDVGFAVTPANANRLDVTWMSTNNDVANVTYKENWTSHHKYVSGVAEGTAEIFLTYKNKEGTVISSNHLKVKVNGVPEQDKTNAVYDLKITGSTDVYADPEDEKSEYLYTSISAINSIDNTAPYTIKGHNVGTLEAKNTESFGKDGVVMKLDPSSMAFMNKGFYSEVVFDFGDQQVCSANFYYAMSRSNQRDGVSHLSEIYLATSNDGENWSAPIDMKEEMVDAFSKANLNYDANKKMMEREFAAASYVKLFFKSSTVGATINIVMDNFVFKHDETCHDHTDVVDVPVTNVNIASSSSSMKVGKTVQFAVSSILPEDASNKNVTWHSSDEGVLTIDATGLATGVAAGTAEVYATSSNGVESNRVSVTVIGQEYLPESVKGTYLIDDFVLNLQFWDLKLEVPNTTSAKLTATREGEEDIVMDFVFDTYDKESRWYVFKTANGTPMTVEFTDDGAEVILTTSVLQLGQPSNNVGEVFTKYVAGTSITVKHDGAAVTSASLTVGDTYSVSATVNPTKAYYKDIAFESKDTSVATIEEGEYYGYNIKAVGVGTTEIAFSTKDGATGTLTVTVAEPVLASSINVSASSNTVAAGDTLKLNVEVLPANVSSYSLSYESSDTKVASVSNKGVVTGISAGKATITVTDSVSGKSGSIEITVTGANAVAEQFVGTWNGYDLAYNEFTFVINADGTAVLSSELLSSDLHFTMTSGSTTTYNFVCDEDSGLTCYIYGTSSNSKNMEFEDANGLTGDLYLTSGPCEVTK